MVRKYLYTLSQLTPWTLDNAWWQHECLLLKTRKCVECTREPYKGLRPAKQWPFSLQIWLEILAVAGPLLGLEKLNLDLASFASSTKVLLCCNWSMQWLKRVAKKQSKSRLCLGIERHWSSAISTKLVQWSNCQLQSDERKSWSFIYILHFQYSLAALNCCLQFQQIRCYSVLFCVSFIYFAIIFILLVIMNKSLRFLGWYNLFISWPHFGLNLVALWTHFGHVLVAFRLHFCQSLVAFFVPFWSHLVYIFVAFLSHCDFILVSLWSHFGLILVSNWSHFGCILVALHYRFLFSRPCYFGFGFVSKYLHKPLWIHLWSDACWRQAELQRKWESPGPKTKLRKPKWWTKLWHVCWISAAAGHKNPMDLTRLCSGYETKTRSKTECWWWICFALETKIPLITWLPLGKHIPIINDEIEIGFSK